MRPVERRNRNQVECREHKIEQNSKDEHQLENRRTGSECRDSAANQIDEQDHGHTEECNDNVGRYTGEGNDDVALLEVCVIAGIYRHRFRTAECNSSGNECQKRKDDREERIYVLCGIPGESAELVCGGVAVSERRVAVRIFVRDHREEQDRRDQNECLELVQFGSRESLRSARVEVTQYPDGRTT